MSNLIELEAGYKLTDFENILKKIKEYDYKLNYRVTEQDTYYTDKDLEFIKNRICLRTRKVNNESLELTFKLRSDANTEKYGKKEVNIQLKVEDLEDIKFIIKNLGYDEYVSFIKHRTVYSKEEFGFEHNIMLDEIEGVGYFAELELISHNETEKEQLHAELENYIKRLEQLEEIANSFDGVEKSYAIQAGRELRVLVKPDQIDDLKSFKVARDIKNRIENEMQYPGTVKVTVIGETRAVEEAK